MSPTRRKRAKAGDSLYIGFPCGKWRWMQVSPGKAGGCVPRAAQGLFKLALQECGYSDPADTVQVIEHERRIGVGKSDLRKRLSPQGDCDQ